MERTYEEILELLRIKGKTQTGGDFRLFGQTLRFSLAGRVVPMLRPGMHWKVIAEELLWQWRGNTNALLLKEKGVHGSAWEQCTSKEFIEKTKATKIRIVGDAGPTVGFAWRHFGAPYKTCLHDYADEGTDQLRAVLYDLRVNRLGRNIILSGRNPRDIAITAIHPREVDFLFSVEPETLQMHCTAVYRACEARKGLPHAVAFSALLCHILAQLSGLVASTLTLVAHEVYASSLPETIEEKAELQPTLKFRAPFATVKDVEAATYRDFVLQYTESKKDDDEKKEE